MPHKKGGSPDRESIGSGTKKSSVSSGSKPKDRKQFLRRFADSEILTANLEDWLVDTAEKSAHEAPDFDVPFELIDLQKFDYALEGFSFQQLIQMPSAVYPSTSGTVEATTYLALEDFFHATVKGLWEAFWSWDEPMPFYISCLCDANSKFYQSEKAIAKGEFESLRATAVMLKNPRHPQGRWDDVIELALLRPDIGSRAVECERKPSVCAIGEALFCALRILIYRSLSRSNMSFNSVYILLVDSQYGGVVKVEGDLKKMDFDVTNVYGCASEWMKYHSRVSISPVDRIWNKLGNANWGDVGALQVLFATFHSIAQYVGLPKNSIEDLAADYSSHLQGRRIERQLEDSRVNGNSLFCVQQCSVSPEIVEVPEESIRVESEKVMKLELGSVLWVEDSNWQKSYQMNEMLSDGEIPYYIASFIEDPGRPLFLYVGSHPSQLLPAWEDMKLWYRVQRQTKVLTVMKQKGVCSRYLPQLDASGRIIQPGQCRKPSSGRNCDHPHQSL